jgi:hypothetical protein
LPSGGKQRAAVVFSARVPRKLLELVREDESGIATLLMNPDEARELATLLQEAVRHANAIGGPLYDDE